MILSNISRCVYTRFSMLLLAFALGACGGSATAPSSTSVSTVQPQTSATVVSPESSAAAVSPATPLPATSAAAVSTAVPATPSSLPESPAVIAIPEGQVVAPAVETEPMPHDGDAADDPAIWVNPADPALSTIIGTDKRGGLAVYDLKGAQLQYLPDGDMNNVDLRDGFSLGGGMVTLVTAGNRSDNSIAIYRIDPATRRLENVAARTIETLETYGSCMYRSATTGAFYYFVNSKDGAVEQWELFDSGGKVDARRVRAFAVGSQTEGCVADDKLGRFYIGEEQVGIWRYGAEPGDGDARSEVDHTGEGGHLTSNIEGLALIAGPGGAGYLIASSQGSDSYVIYRRADNAYVASFTIGEANGIDAVGGTDGIDATAASLGPGFPRGVFVAQDGTNSGGNQNFKLVPLERILGEA